MEYYLVLGVATLTTALLTLVLWLRTRQTAFVFGAAVLYYWSLYGAWAIVRDGLGGDSGMHYEYLFDRLFQVRLDRDYLTTLVLYSVFIVVTLVTLLLTHRRARGARSESTRPLQVSHVRLLAASVSSLVGSYLIVRPALSTAIWVDSSAYALTREPGAVGVLFTLHQVLNRVALVPLALGTAVALSAGRGLYLRGGGRNWLVAYGVAIAAVYSFCVLLGNKNELFFALVLGVFFFLANEPEVRKGRLMVVAVAGFALVALVDALRGQPVMDLLSQMSFQVLVDSLVAAPRSNEAFGAHLSMYGAVHFAIPLLYGESLLSLAASAVPRLFWPDRMEGVYDHYARTISAASGQGYSIHHATGWYLNFGTAGVVFGAVVLGWIWAIVFNRLQVDTKARPLWSRAFGIVAPWGFTAGLANLVRAGIEGYKGMVVDGFLIPTVVVIVAAWSVAPSVSAVPPRSAAPSGRRGLQRVRTGQLMRVKPEVSRSDGMGLA